MTLYIKILFIFPISIRVILSMCSILRNIKVHLYHRPFIYRENPAELTITSQVTTSLKVIIMDDVLPHYVFTQVLKAGGICTCLK